MDNFDEQKPYGACQMCGELLNEEEAPNGYCECCDNIGSMEEKMNSQAEEIIKENNG